MIRGVIHGFTHQIPDGDPEETREWVDSFDALVDRSGRGRARFLLARLMERAGELNVGNSPPTWTPYVNTIATTDQPWFPGDEHIERRIRAFIRWNAAAMVINANKTADGIGGHLSTFASSASLYEVGAGKVLSGLARRINRDISTAAIGTPAEVEAALAALS